MSDLSRRRFVGAAAGLCAAPSLVRAEKRGPNVIIVLTDDQGYGDMSCHGNPILRTPNMDMLHASSVRFTQFHSAPMCTPTRGQLLTGVDCLRNGAAATACGRSQLRENIPTMPGIFAAAGYETGIFGKWHLGYSWPHRPMDRGFREANYFLGYGITGAGDFWNNDYFNPRYYHNGEPQRARGYCTDVWFDLAMNWMDRCRVRRQPFFCYVPTNAPHFPEWVSDAYRKPYASRGPAEYFGMVANLDENIGRLEAYLRKTGLRDNTILLFMTDNGGVTGVPVFNAGMRGHKTSLYDGGHRVPCFVRWPAGRLRHGTDVNTQAQMQDILPTLIDLCGLKSSSRGAFDGMSLAGLLRSSVAVPDRMFVVQYYQNSLRQGDAAVIWNRWRLIKGSELYDIEADPGQSTNVAATQAEIAGRMRDYYERWWARVEPRLSDLVPSHIGAEEESTTMLPCSEWQDVRCDGQPTVRTAAGGKRGGPWNIAVERAGQYTVELRRWPKDADLALGAGTPEFRATEGILPVGKALPIASARMTAGGREFSKPLAAQDKAATFDVALSAGRTQLHGWFRDEAGQDLCGAYFAYVARSSQLK